MWYNNIGLSYSKLGELEKALKYYKKALTINTEIFDDNEYGFIFNNPQEMGESRDSFEDIFKVRSEYKFHEFPFTKIIKKNLEAVKEKIK